MSKIAICDFDGVIADIAEHTKIAQTRARAYALELALDPKEEAYRKALSTFFVIPILERVKTSILRKLYP